jgi:hypothetical protein
MEMLHIEERQEHVHIEQPAHLFSFSAWAEARILQIGFVE